MTDEKITKLPVRFKEGTEDHFLVIKGGSCDHRCAVFVDPKLAEVECSKCGEKLNPIDVLTIMAAEETGWHRAHQRYQDEMRRLAERQRTKCEHCGEMTTISRR